MILLAKNPLYWKNDLNISLVIHRILSFIILKKWKKERIRIWYGSWFGSMIIMLCFCLARLFVQWVNLNLSRYTLHQKDRLTLSTYQSVGASVGKVLPQIHSSSPKVRILSCSNHIDFWYLNICQSTPRSFIGFIPQFLRFSVFFQANLIGVVSFNKTCVCDCLCLSFCQFLVFIDIRFRFDGRVGLLTSRSYFSFT